MVIRFLIHFFWFILCFCSSSACFCMAARREARPLVFFVGLFLFSLYLASRMASSFSSLVVLRRVHIIAAEKNREMK